MNVVGEHLYLRALVVFFSGTGGTRRIADETERVLTAQGVAVTKRSLEKRESKEFGSVVDLIILVFPVHAFDAPEPVYGWVKGLPQGDGMPVAVISVSGGGEIWPNTFSRRKIIKALETKQYDVSFEDMMVMPSNIFVATNDHLAMHLLQTLPAKIEQIVGSILLGKRRRKFPVKFLNLLWFVPIVEKIRAKHFGKAIYASGACSGCSWCAENCPRNNIEMVNGKPVFGSECVICLRCIYGCSEKALRPQKYRFLLVQGGYSISEVESRMEGVALQPISECAKGFLWAGVLKYLRDVKKASAGVNL